MLFLRALFAFLALPTVVGGVVPWLILRNDHPRTAGTLLGWPISLFGGSVLLWCVRDFYVVGKGTLAPWDPPKKLVTVGLYRFVRNPIYVGVFGFRIAKSVWTKFLLHTSRPRNGRSNRCRTGFLGVIAAPLIPLLSGIRPVAGIIVLMVIWWVTEAVPTAATALLPLILFPLTGVLPLSVVAANYVDDSVFLFLGGILIAIGLEESGLSRRFALNTIFRISQNPQTVVRAWAQTGRPR